MPISGRIRGRGRSYSRNSIYPPPPGARTKRRSLPAPVLSNHRWGSPNSVRGRSTYRAERPPTAPGGSTRALPTRRRNRRSSVWEYRPSGRCRSSPGTRQRTETAPPTSSAAMPKSRAPPRGSGLPTARQCQRASGPEDAAIPTTALRRSLLSARRKRHSFWTRGWLRSTQRARWRERDCPRLPSSRRTISSAEARAWPQARLREVPEPRRKSGERATRPLSGARLPSPRPPSLLQPPARGGRRFSGTAGGARRPKVQNRGSSGSPNRLPVKAG